MSHEVTRRQAMTGLALPLFPGFALGSGMVPPEPPPAPPAGFEPPASGQLPPLPVAFYDADGTFIRTTTLDDPRESFCRHYNELNEGIRTAKPLVPAAQTYTAYISQPDGTTLVEEFDAADAEAWHVELHGGESGDVTLMGRYGKREQAQAMADDLGPSLARVTGPHAR